MRSNAAQADTLVASRPQGEHAARHRQLAGGRAKASLGHGPRATRGPRRVGHPGAPDQPSEGRAAEPATSTGDAAVGCTPPSAQAGPHTYRQCPPRGAMPISKMPRRRRLSPHTPRVEVPVQGDLVDEGAVQAGAVPIADLEAARNAASWARRGCRRCRSARTRPRDRSLTTDSDGACPVSSLGALRLLPILDASTSGLSEGLNQP